MTGDTVLAIASSVAVMFSRFFGCAAWLTSLVADGHRVPMALLQVAALSLLRVNFAEVSMKYEVAIFVRRKQ